jgi:hypothetical protein
MLHNAACLFLKSGKEKTLLTEFLLYYSKRIFQSGRGLYIIIINLFIPVKEGLKSLISFDKNWRNDLKMLIDYTFHHLCFRTLYK